MTELVDRHQIRPVIQSGATIMDRLFGSPADRRAAKAVAADRIKSLRRAQEPEPRPRTVKQLPEPMVKHEPELHKLRCCQRCCQRGYFGRACECD